MTEKLPHIPPAYQPPVSVPVDASEPPLSGPVLPYQPPRRIRGAGGLVVLATLVSCIGGAVVIGRYRSDDEAPARSAPAASAPPPAAAPTSTAGWPELVAQPAGAESDQRDTTYGGPTWIHFTNTTAGTVSVMWLDYDHHRVWYNALSPGQGYDQQTYAGHVWVITEAGGAAIAVYTATAEPALAVIR